MREMDAMMPSGWREVAECRGEVDVMFPPLSGGEPDLERYRRLGHALTLCEACPVAAECREYGEVTRQPAGVWGGEIRDSGQRRGYTKQAFREMILTQFAPGVPQQMGLVERRESGLDWAIRRLGDAVHG